MQKQPKPELDDGGESATHRMARVLGKAAVESAQFVVWSALIGGSIAVGAAIGVDIAEHLTNTVPGGSELGNFLETLSYAKPILPALAVTGAAGAGAVKLLPSSEIHE